MEEGCVANLLLSVDQDHFENTMCHCTQNGERNLVDGNVKLFKLTWHARQTVVDVELEQNLRDTLEEELRDRSESIEEL